MDNPNFLISRIKSVRQSIKTINKKRTEIADASSKDFPTLTFCNLANFHRSAKCRLGTTPKKSGNPGHICADETFHRAPSCTYATPGRGAPASVRLRPAKTAKATPHRAVPSTIVSQSLGTIHPRRAASPVTTDAEKDGSHGGRSDDARSHTPARPRPPNPFVTERLKR